MHSEASGCQEHVLQPSEGWELPVLGVLWPLLGVGGQQHPFVHIGHSYVHVLNRGLCVLVCVHSTFLPCDQFNGNLIYLKKKRNTNSYC